MQKLEFSCEEVVHVSFNKIFGLYVNEKDCMTQALFVQTITEEITIFRNTDSVGFGAPAKCVTKVPTRYYGRGGSGEELAGKRQSRKDVINIAYSTWNS